MGVAGVSHTAVGEAHMATAVVVQVTLRAPEAAASLILRVPVLLVAAAEPWERATPPVLVGTSTVVARVHTGMLVALVVYKVRTEPPEAGDLHHLRRLATRVTLKRHIAGT